MRYIKFLFLSLMLLLASAGNVSADNKCEPEMYMFGYAFSFNDSTLYITPVQKVENVWVHPRKGFIIERETYSHQLQSYFEKDGIKDMTCGISFSKKEKKIIKKFNKLKMRYTKKIKHLRVINLSEADFAFKSFVPLQIEEPNKGLDDNKSKKSKKRSKRK